MEKVALPKKLFGEWIWDKSLIYNFDSFLLMRKEFMCQTLGIETNLWITANSSYQLFINGKLVSFGPHAHHHTNVRHVACIDITYYLEVGVNVIAVKVYHSDLKTIKSTMCPPGLWCLAMAQGEKLFATDRTWMIYNANSELINNRARSAYKKGFINSLNAQSYPYNWTCQDYSIDEKWHAPTSNYCLDDLSITFKMQSMAPSIISEETPAINIVETNYMQPTAMWTQVLFNSKNVNSNNTFAALSYIYCDKNIDVTVSISTDDPFKIFCNNSLVASGEFMINHSAVLELSAGWNKLLVIQRPNKNSMGVFINFNSVDKQTPIKLLKNMDENSISAWNVSTALKLKLEEATASIKLDNLVTYEYRPKIKDLSDVNSFLRLSQVVNTKAINIAEGLKTDEAVTYKLDYTRYGFVNIIVNANEGDIVDITLGTKLTQNHIPELDKNYRTTHSIKCVDGENNFLTFLPADVLYIMISIRKASDKVDIISVEFKELVHEVVHQATFHSSDEVFNKLWELGMQSIRRSTGFVPMEHYGSDCDIYMLDAYIDSVNVSTCLGDFDYLKSRIKQFLDAQLENGNIPVLSFGEEQISQRCHLFFLPIWLEFYVKTTGDIQTLNKMLPSLDMAREYFEAMIDESSGLLNHSNEVNSNQSLGNENRLTIFNSLFCRFLISASEIYKLTNQINKANFCIEQSEKLAESLWNNCYNVDDALFYDKSLSENSENKYSLLDNFYAMYSGIYPFENFEYFFHKFFNFESPYDTSVEANNSYFHFLFMEMMFALEQRDWALGYFRDYWSRKISQDNSMFISAVDDNKLSSSRFVDGNCVLPNVFLIREVLGLRVANMCESTLYFNPPYDLIDWCEAIVVTANGRIKIKWEKLLDNSLDVTIEADFFAKIVIQIPQDKLAQTTMRLGEKVTLLNDSV